MALPRKFYERDTLEVAKDLLGKTLVRRTPRGVMKARLIEVEAYKENDPASHSCRGVTPRNKVMYGPPGHAYVYFCYGNHWLLNFVTEPQGRAGAVLVRGVKPLKGLDIMKQNRGGREPLADGPGKLCQALSINGKDNGVDVTRGDLTVQDGPKPEKIRKSSRIGIKQGVDRQWRFFVAEQDF
jgi:DNA-3-methyladenine glycosylase